MQYLSRLIKSSKNCVKPAKYCLTTLGLDGDATYRMSKWIQKIQVSILEPLRNVDKVESAMCEILMKSNRLHCFAFYGPKLDIQAKMYMAKKIL